MGEIARLRREAETKLAEIEVDRARWSEARSEGMDRVRHILTKPTTLMALFAAGFLLGFLRRRDHRDDEHDTDDDSDTEHRTMAGRVTSLATIILSGIRIFEMARRAGLTPWGR